MILFTKLYFEKAPIFSYTIEYTLCFIVGKVCEHLGIRVGKGRDLSLCCLKVGILPIHHFPFSLSQLLKS